MSKHYVYRTVNGKRVRMPAARAARIRAKVTTPTKPKPRSLGPYQGLAQVGPVNDAVNSVITSQVRPLQSQRKDMNATTDANLAANAGLAQQTQGTLASLMEDARRGKGAMLMTAAQGAASMRGAQSGAVAELQQAFGPQAMNEQIRALIAQGMQAPSAALNAASVGDIYGAGLGGQMQQDFFGRAQAVAAVSQQSFNEEQRRQQAAAVRKIAEAIAGVKGQAGALRRQFVREDAQFGLERRSAEQAFGLQVAGMEGAAAADAEQRQYDRGQDAIDNQEDYTALQLRQQGQGAKGAEKLSTDQRKAMNTAIDYVRKQAQRVGMAGPTRNMDGVSTSSTLTNGDVFGAGNGPWRELYKRLGRAGVPASQAAMVAVQEYPGSVSRSTPRRFSDMLKGLGVPKPTRKAIIVGEWGNAAWLKLTGVKGTGTANSGRGMPSPAAAAGSVAGQSPEAKAKAWARRLQGETIKEGRFTGKLTGYLNGKWYIKAANGRSTSIPYVTGQSPRVAIRKWWNRIDVAGGNASQWT